MPSLTDIKIRALRGARDRREIADGNGLYLIVQPSGSKSFALRFRQGGKPVKLTLGTFFEGEVRDAPEPKMGGQLTLKGARNLASKELLKIDKGIDPVKAKKEAMEAKQRAAKNTFKSVATKYMELECGMRVDASGTTFDLTKLRTGPDRWRVLRRQVFPALGAKPITDIRRSDINDLLDDIALGKLKDDEGKPIEGGPVAADRTLAIIRKIMNWHAVRSNDYRSPIVRGMAKVKQPSERARKRILTDPELRVVWKTAGEDTGPFGALIQFLLLTAARRNEAAKMEWSEINGTDWCCPMERNKVGKAEGDDLIRPLSEAARAVLKARPQIKDCAFVFTYGRGPLQSFSKPKREFDALVANELGKSLPRWTLHDLRRTARTLMTRAGVPSEHAERCLGHVIPGVQGVYNQHKYQAEMTLAYEALASLIERIVNPPADNVVAFSKAGD
jgi:integrase